MKGDQPGPLLVPWSVVRTLAPHPTGCWRRVGRIGQCSAPSHMRLLATLIAFGSAPLSSTEEAANALQKRATERVTTRNRRPFYAPLSSDYEFPLNLTTPGYEGGVRPDAGDDSVLRAAIARALADPTYNLTILVIGGSEPQGSECKDDYVEGVVEAGVYVWWNNFPIYGRTDCPWPARLAQYLLRLLPHRNFVIVNGAMGGCGSGCFLGSQREIYERTQNEPRYPRGGPRTTNRRRGPGAGRSTQRRPDAQLQRDRARSAPAPLPRERPVRTRADDRAARRAEQWGPRRGVERRQVREAQHRPVLHVCAAARRASPARSAVRHRARRHAPPVRARRY